MNKIFIGMVLLILDFHVTFNSSQIGLIPDFLGYIFILNGLSEMAVFSDRFSKISPYVKGLVVFSVILYVMDLFGISVTLGVTVSFVLELLSSILVLFISYHIIMGIKDVETTKMQNLNGSQLYSAWKLLAALYLVMYLFFFIFPILVVICAVIGFFVSIYGLVKFYQAKNLFYKQNPIVNT